MPKELIDGDRLLTPDERLRVMNDVSYQVEPILVELRRLAEEESKDLRFFCIAILPRLSEQAHRHFGYIRDYFEKMARTPPRVRG